MAFLFALAHRPAAVRRTANWLLRDLTRGREMLTCIQTDRRTQPISVVRLTVSRADRDVVESYPLGVTRDSIQLAHFGQFTTAMRLRDIYWLCLTNRPCKRMAKKRMVIPCPSAYPR